MNEPIRTTLHRVVTSTNEPVRSRLPLGAPHGSDAAKSAIRDAARTLFADQGYARTSTKAIAERAGVTETLLFRHFGDKPRLFREAIQAALSTALSGFVAEQAGLGENLYSPYEAGRGLIEQLSGVLADGQKGALIAWTGALAFLPEVRSVLDSHEQPMNGLLVELERILIRYAAAEDFIGLNPPLSARLVVGTVIGMTVFNGWLPPGDEGPLDDHEIIDELAMLLVHGLLFRIAESSGADAGIDFRASSVVSLSGPADGRNSPARDDGTARDRHGHTPGDATAADAPPPAARRRRSDEIRPLILDAASVLFAQHGYIRTTTRALAAEAAVSEALVYKNFRTKGELFEAVVRERYGPVVSTFAETRCAAGPASSESRLLDFFDDLVGFARSIRGIVLALMAADAHDATIGSCAGEALRRILADMHATVMQCALVDGSGRSFAGVRGSLTGSAVLALILGATVVDDVVFAEPGRRTSNEPVREEVVGMVLYGVSHRNRRGTY